MSRKPENTYIWDEQNNCEIVRYRGRPSTRLAELEYQCYMEERDVEFINDWTRRISEYNY